MSDEPVAKRTRLSVSRPQSEDMKSIEEMGQEMKVMYNTMMSKFKVMRQLVPKMSQKINAMKEQVPETKEGTALQLRIMENNVNRVQDNMKSAQKKLSSINLYIDYISIERLHDHDCTGSDADVLKMQEVLIQDPLSLERKREIEIVFNKDAPKHSPLHAAVKEGHVKCVKFLLESGADVTSLTSENDTIFHTMYNNDLFYWNRSEILKLLLNHGASCMFSYNQTKEFSIQMASLNFAAEDISLLLQHGATLNCLNTRRAMRLAWRSFELPMVKLLFLHSPDLYVGPSGLYKQLIHLCYKKMILQGVRIELCHEKFLEALKYFKVFGGMFLNFPYFWHADEGLMKFLKSYKHRQHFRGAKSKIKTLISNPMSLKEISRLAVRRYIPKDYLEKIRKLEVPEDLQPFLRFDDVTITDLPDYFDDVGDVDSSSDGEEGEDDDSDF